MQQLPNPDWTRQGNSWYIERGVWRGEIWLQPDSISTFLWTITKYGSSVFTGTSYDRIGAMSTVERRLGYPYLLEEEWVMDKGCRCGSCTHYTGAYIVSDRPDTVEQRFADRESAIAWIEGQIAHEPDCDWWSDARACNCADLANRRNVD